MSIIRIDDARKRTHGWQARKHGGKRKAYEAALAAERKLMRGR